MTHTPLMLALITVMSGLLAAIPVSAQPVPAAFQGYVPRVAENRFVYLAPAPGFRPHALGMSGVTALEADLRALTFPFYLILANRFPETENASQDAHALLEIVDREWRQDAPLHAPDTASFLLVVTNPVIVTLRIGSRWSGQYHLREEEFEPSLRTLRQQVERGDPAQRTTILEIARLVEHQALERSDPRRQQAQAQAMQNAERERARAQELPGLRDEVDQSLDLLIGPHARRLGRDRQWLRERIQHARSLMEQGDPTLMRVAAHELRYDRRFLNDLVRAREAVEGQEFERYKHRIMIGSLLALLVFALIVQRARRGALLRQAVSNEHLLMQTTVERVRISKEQTFEEARARIAVLAHTEGVSKTQYLRVTKEVDEIYAQCCGLRARVLSLRQALEAGSFWHMSALEEAFESLGTPIRYTLVSEEQAVLFEPRAHTVVIPLQDVRYEIELRIERVRAGWKGLLEISALREQAPEQAFSDVILEQLHELLLKEGLDAEWLHGHPLLRGEASEALYQELDALRLRNPVGYHERVSLLSLEEGSMSEALTALITLRRRVRDAMIHELVIPEGTILNTRDHPATTLKRADKAREEFETLFRARRPLAELTTAAENAIALYTRTSMQAHELTRAVNEVGTLLSECTDGQSRVRQLRSTALQCCINVRAHTKDLDTSTSLSECDRDRERANELMASAQRLLVAKRHLEAFQEASRAKHYLIHSEQGLHALIDLCHKASSPS